jgi:hypothetical protein
MAARETYLATIKQRSDDYQKNKGGAATPAFVPEEKGFKF